jgi:hypothetical protein
MCRAHALLWSGFDGYLLEVAGRVPARRYRIERITDGGHCLLTDERGAMFSARLPLLCFAGERRA